MSDRPAFLRFAIDQVPPDQGLTFLLDLVTQTMEPFDPATRATVVDLSIKLPQAQTVDWSDWFGKKSQLALLPTLAEQVVRCLPDKPDQAAAIPANLVMAAAAWKTSGDSEQADRAALRAIEALQAAGGTTDGEPGAAGQASTSPSAAANGARSSRMGREAPDRISLLRVAISSLSADARTRLLGVAEAQTTRPGAMTGSSVLGLWQTITRINLLEATGDGAQGLEVLRGAFFRDPTNPTLLSMYADRLKADGRYAEIIENLASRASGQDMSARMLQRAVAQARKELFRWREVRAQPEATANGPEMATPAAAGDIAALSTGLRILLQGVRDARGLQPSIDVPSAGGFAAAGNITPGLPASLLTDFVRWPGSTDDLMQSVSATSPPVNAYLGPAPAWTPALLARAGPDNAVSQRLLEGLMTSAKAHTLKKGERLLATSLATQNGVQLPQTILDELLPAAVADGTGKESVRLAEALSAQHAPGAVNVKRWADVVLKTSGRYPTADSIPSAPTPLDPQDDATLMGWLTPMLKSDPAVAEVRLAEMRASGRVSPRSMRANLLWARLVAERNDMAAFNSRLGEVLNFPAWQQHLGSAGMTLAAASSSLPADFRDSLPAKGEDPKRREAVIAVAEKALAEQAERSPGDADIVRYLSQLGS